VTKRENFLSDPLWYKDAIIYELHVRSFRDSDSDGIGDFRGLTEKLDYLQQLGVTAIWLLPFFPSPLRDDGYDISDYRAIHPDYGTLGDFKAFLSAAHRRGIRVIAELVVNHTSSEHRWFQRARDAAPGSSARNFYVWSDSPFKYGDARIIFKDFESSNWTLDHKARAYYWHRFYTHQPDLNFDNPAVQREIFAVLDFWLAMGVDGVRLDAVPYLYEREGTNCENLPETHAFLKKLRAHVDKIHPGKMLLAEANQWPEDAVAYFGTGDECHMAFHFPLMPRLFMAVQMEDSFPIIDILRTTPQIPDTCQWAMFLRNHDELTLEMVTDEERDYMYRVYAREPRAKINAGIRRRLAPLLSNNRKKIELMNILLFSFPGTPVLYYGDELGMGDNYYLGDRNGMRTPMHWSADRNAGFSEANPQKLFLPIVIDPEYHYEAINVENQQANLSSMLWWMRRVIAIRKQFKAFSRGDMKFIHTDNSKIMAFSRSCNGEHIIVAANLSRFSQPVSLDLKEFTDFIPEELFSKNAFPPISGQPYTLTFGPHSHYWFLLRKPVKKEEFSDTRRLLSIRVDKSWEDVLAGKAREDLEYRILPAYLPLCRWFGSKAKGIRKISIADDLHVGEESPHLLLLLVAYNEGIEEYYLLPVSFVTGEEAVRKCAEEHPHGVICNLQAGDTTGLLIDGTCDPQMLNAFFAVIAERKKMKGKYGVLTGAPGAALKEMLSRPGANFEPSIFKAEQSNTSVRYGQNLLMKLYRRQNEGTNPELDALRFLTEKTRFNNIPPFAGVLEYRRMGSSQPWTVALLQGFVENVGDAWHYSLDVASKYFERALFKRSQIAPSQAEPLFQIVNDSCEAHPIMLDLVGALFIEMVALLGKRTAEMHIALASSPADPVFAPEPFSILYQRSMYQSMQSLVRKNLDLLNRQTERLPRDLQDDAKSVMAAEKPILDSLRSISREKISAVKTRIHGDYHLGQVLYTGKDFVVMDFEGEPARSLGERKLKYSPVKDVAGMVRSFHYAAYGALFLDGTLKGGDLTYAQSWVDPWYRLTKGVFLSSYLRTAGTLPIVPQRSEEFDLLLRVYLLEKAVYELGYELNNRPKWTAIPIKGILTILDELKSVDAATSANNTAISDKKGV
jgi:maltose alpha-D-glucosyltransferase/alpha-amylase